MRWRYLISEPATGAWNMALDSALLERARASDEGVLRIYGWSVPTLSLGRNQVAHGAYDLQRARTIGVQFVRRPTGGRALLHHREVTYSITAPVARLGEMRESYDRVNRLLMAGLRALGLPVQVAAGAQPTPSPDTAPCFDRPGAGEIVAGGRKLVGSAQLREDGAMLQHGSILVADDQPLAAELLIDSREQPPPAATLTELLGWAPPATAVAACLIGALHDLEDRSASPLIADGELDRRAQHALARYQDVKWTWRR